MSEQARWTQDISDMYRRLAGVAVPAREEQYAALLTLIPFGKHERFRVVELAAGEGRLSNAILHAFPNATLLALDGEESMRQETAARLAAFGARAEVGAFDMPAPDWYPLLEGADVVVSSLCIHHLTAEGKQALFNAVCARLSQRGAFLIADLILPQRDEGRRLFAATWDRTVEVQSTEKTGASELADLFVQTKWNYYHYPDPFDTPSPLFDQLMWLRTAGFEVADCFWMQAGHSIYGGYRQFDGVTTAQPLSYAEALLITRQCLR